MTGRIKNSTEKTSFVVFKFDFCKKPESFKNRGYSTLGFSRNVIA